MKRKLLLNPENPSTNTSTNARMHECTNAFAPSSLRAFVPSRLRPFALSPFRPFALSPFRAFALIALCTLLALAAPPRAQAQSIVLTPTTNTALNPPYIVPLGDSLVYTFTLSGGTAVANTVTKIIVPDGYEILPSTPNQVGGTLAPDRKSVVINTPVTTISPAPTHTVYIKPLCNANVFSNDPTMIVAYELYPTAGNAASGTGMLTRATEIFANIYEPIINVTYPAGQNTTLNATVVRNFTFAQTAALSHVNAFEVTMNVTDKSGFEITKVEVSKDNVTWIDITASALDPIPAGKYVYRITRDNTFKPLNFTGFQLQQNDKVYVRETVILKKCDAGSINYTVAAGDGTNYCPIMASASANLNLGVATPGFGNDILNGTLTYPRSPSIDGQWRVQIQNTSVDPLAVMKDVHLRFGWNNTQWRIKSAYIVNSSGAIIAGAGGATDTIFLSMTAGTGPRDIYLNNLTNPANAAIYNSIGFIDADGDGIHNDFNIGKNVYIQFRFNIDIPTAACPTSFLTGTSTVGWGYYKWCGNDVQFGRAYGAGGASFWVNSLCTQEIRDVNLQPAFVRVGDPAVLHFLKYEHPNAGFLNSSIHGDDINATSTYYSYLTLPIGLDYDPSRPLIMKDINGNNYPVNTDNPFGSSIPFLPPPPPSPTRGVEILQFSAPPSTPMIIKVRIFATLHGDGTRWEVPVIANSIMNNAGTFHTENSYDYGNTGTAKCFGSFNPSVTYVKATPCSDIELMNFSVDRTSLGYTSTTKTTIISAANANTKVIYPFDNVTLTTNLAVRSNVDISGTKVITASASYDCQATAIASAYLIPQPGMVNPATLIFYRGGSTFYVNIPAADLKQPAAFDQGAASIASFRYKQYLETDIAKAIRTLGITTLQAGDSVVLYFYTRSTATLPNTNDYATRPTMMTLYDGVNPRVASPTNIICYPIIDNDVKIVMYYFTNFETDNGDAWSSWDERTQSSSNDLFYGFVKSVGGVNMLTNGEYRPNLDTFSTLTFVYDGLIKVNNIAIGLWNTGAFGNETARTYALTEYTVSYANGKTTIVIDPLKDHMFTGIAAVGWVGYWISVRWESINPGAGNNLITQKTATLSATEYPTSANPQKRTFTNRVIGTDHMNNAIVNYYKMAINTPSPIQSPKTNMVEWSFAIENQSTWVNTDPILPYTWIAFEAPNGITPSKLIDVTNSNAVIADISVAGQFIPYTNASGDTYYWVKLGNVTANPSHSYKLQCTYTICTGTPALTLRTGMSKLDYPQDPYNSFAQAPYNSPQMPFHTTASTQLKYNPPIINFSGTVVHRPSPTGTYDPVTNSTVTAGKNLFCDTIGFRATYYNGTDAVMYNLKLEISLPVGSGYTWSNHPNYHCGPVRVKYANGAWAAPQSAVLQGSKLIITLDDTFDPTKVAGAYNPADNSDEVYVDFTLHVGCGFENRTQLKANFYAESGCGGGVDKNYATGQMQINGLALPPAYAWDNLNLIQTPFTGTVGNDGTMLFTGTYRSIAPTEDDVKAIIDLPENLTLVSNNTGAQLNFTQDGTRLMADLPPAGLGSGVTSTFSLTLRPTNPAAWTTDTFYIYLRVGKMTTLSCLGSNCTLLEIGEQVDSVMLSMDKVQVKFDEHITAHSWYNDPTTERVQIQYALINYGDLDAARLTVDFVYFDGVDYIPVNGVIGGGRVVNGIMAGDTVPLTLNVNVSYMQDVCNMFLMLRKWTDEPGAMNAYLADSSIILVPVPIYHILPGPDPICQLSAAQMIGEPAIRDYHYTWEPADHLNRATVSPTAFSFDYENYPQWNDTTLKYAISIIRPNGCVSVDTLPVEIKGMAWVQDLTDTTICSGNSYRIDFTDEHNPLGTTIFRWTIMNGPNVSMPASGTTPYINVAQVRNTGTQPVVLQVQVTPKKGGCDGITKTYFITVNPKPRINYIADQIYCAGQIVPTQTISGDNSAALYHWQFDNGDNLFAPTTNGINLIPNFIAQNNTSSDRIGNYFAYAAYENAGITCYSDSVRFAMKIEPMPSVVLNPAGDKNLCSGGNLNVTFNTAPSGTTVSWQKTSGQNIPGLATNGTANPIILNNIINNGTTPIQAVYTVTPVSASGRCMGGTDNFIIAINPFPALTSLKNFTQCSGEIFSYNLTSGVSGVGFTWERNLITSSKFQVSELLIGANVLSVNPICVVTFEVHKF